MRLANPADLDDKTGSEIAALLFGKDLTETSWSLERINSRVLEWRDRRLGLTWRIGAGYLIGLQEVSSVEDALKFGKHNRIKILKEGGLYFRGTAELPILCSRPPPAPTIAGFEGSVVGIRTRGGIEGFIGYPSFLFERLIGRPLQERNPRVPDPETTNTLVIRNVEFGDVHQVAELMLHLLREHSNGTRFLFCRFEDTITRSSMDVETTEQLILPADPLPDTTMPETHAFFNRAYEGGPIAGFLYYYRVIEACFEDVLKTIVNSWRKDGTISDIELLSRVRKLKDQEDKTGLRAVLGDIVDQALLDRAVSNGLITSASVDVLVTEIYQRRNSIAHGRLGQHREILVPYAFSPGGDAHDQAWYELIGGLARRAMEKFILR